jgi:hypothetical protein
MKPIEAQARVRLEEDATGRLIVSVPYFNLARTEEEWVVIYGPPSFVAPEWMLVCALLNS